jgi:hypothetical protein
MSGNDFYDKTTRTTIIEPVVGPEPHPDAGDGTAAQRPVDIIDRTAAQLLGEILKELRAIHWHLATITENDPDEIRRDMNA